MQPGLEIRMVRDNLALAIALWVAAEKGLITTEHLPPARSVVTSADGRVLKVHSPLAVKTGQELARYAANQVRAAFAISVMQTHQALEHLYGPDPLQEANPDHQAARSAIYLLNKTFGQGLLEPAWDCPPGYRRRFEVRPVPFILDATALHGKPVSWDHFGGLTRYLDLLEYCVDLVEQGPPPSALPDEAEPETAPLDEEDRPAAAPSGPDPVAGFVAARCVTDPAAKTIARDLYTAYLEWCQEAGRPALAQRSFGMRLTQLGFHRRRRGKGRHWWQGIALDNHQS